MFEVRIHGRGGQGVVTAAELLSVAAFLEGKHAQAFPSFGSERTGAPVVSFCRIDDKEIRLREPIRQPDTLIVQDPTLFKAVTDVFDGIKPNSYLLINTNKSFAELHLADIVTKLPAGHACTGAGERARAQVHRPAAAQCCAARSVRGADRHRPPAIGSNRDPADVLRQNCRSQRRGGERRA
jgi:pyruvate ferredoxin oxidoreductase gamma subunit